MIDRTAQHAIPAVKSRSSTSRSEPGIVKRVAAQAAVDAIKLNETFSSQKDWAKYVSS